MAICLEGKLGFLAVESVLKCLPAFPGGPGGAKAGVAPLLPPANLETGYFWHLSYMENDVK